jgi:hypothetical protein
LRNKALQRQFILEKRNQEKIQKLKEEEERKKKQFLQKMKHIQDIKDNKKLIKNIEEYNRLLKKQEEFVEEQKRNGFRNVEKEELIQRCLALHLAEIKKLRKGKKNEQPLPLQTDLHQQNAKQKMLPALSIIPVINLIDSSHPIVNCHSLMTNVSKKKSETIVRPHTVEKEDEDCVLSNVSQPREESGNQCNSADEASSLNDKNAPSSITTVYCDNFYSDIKIEIEMDQALNTSAIDIKEENLDAVNLDWLNVLEARENQRTEEINQKLAKQIKTQAEQEKKEKTLREKKRKREEEEEEQKLRYTAPKEDTDTSNPWKVVVIDLTKDS